MLNDLLMLKETDRYSADFALPDYPRKADGSIDREAMKNLLLKEEYGFVHTDGVTVDYSVEKDEASKVCGKCRSMCVKVTLSKNEMSASFRILLFAPHNVKKKRAVVHINFDSEVPARYSPIEELMDMGLTIAHICHKEITTDDNDFSTGIAPLLTDRNDPESAGKISIWAYAASLTADYLLKEGFADPDCLAVAGHSRLGKTALLAGALDERFTLVHSNCSGCCGAAISREKTGETIEKIWNRFPFWFCGNFEKYVNKENTMPFDQHFLLALSAPRILSVVTADTDAWADTDAQYICAEAASKVYEEMGTRGLCEEGKILRMGENNLKGNIVFSKRYGTHYFSRTDWQFLNKVLL